MVIRLVVVALALSGCAVTSGPGGGGGGGTGGSDACPVDAASGGTACYTPHSLRVAYGVQPLTEQGSTGKGQTVVDIVSYGSPTLQEDLDSFDQQFGLPAITLNIQSPLGTAPFDPNNAEMAGWQQETTLDVEIIHAIAPDAAIVVLTSPVDETEGTIGLPQFLQLEQYAVQHHLGQIFSQSWSASEATLADTAGRQVVQQFDSFYQQIATQGYTVVTASGDSGATDCAAIDCLDTQGNPDPSKFATVPTISFPASDPWVLTVGGTSLQTKGAGYDETAWACNGVTSGCSGGGTSQFFAVPTYQQGLPAAVRGQLSGQRGIPDVAADADPTTGMAIYVAGQWGQAGGTSAAAPLWAGVLAIANQMAGHPLGFVNPALYRVGESSASAQAFRDITNGNNTVAIGVSDVQGFEARLGWDLITGWGAPRASQMIPALIAAVP
ncbi:MAG TPA: S53 family peptidase [Ktedonobacterales bacterium]